MTQVKRRIGDYASSMFLNSQDVIGREGPAVITAISEREVQDDKKPGGKRLALMIEFDRWPDKAYDCNSTNIRVLQDMLGEDVSPDDLRGVRVFLTTHQTNFGRGILFQPPQDSTQGASAAARQRVANAVAANESPPPKTVNTSDGPVALFHSHHKGEPCEPAACDVADAVAQGFNVYESFPPLPTPEPAKFVSQRQPPAGPASTHGKHDAAPGQYHDEDPGPIAAPADSEIPF